MPPKPKPKPTKIPTPTKNVAPVNQQSYILEFIANQILLIGELQDSVNKILIRIKIGSDISFDLITNKVDCEFQKAKITHEIKVSLEKLITIVEMPVKIYFKPAPPELDAIDKNKNDENNKKDDKKKNDENKNDDHKIEKKDKKGKKKNVEDNKNVDQAAATTIIEDDNFGELSVNWQPIVLKRVSENKFSIHTQFEEQDILKPIIKTRPSEEIVEDTVKRPVPAATNLKELTPNEEEQPREAIGYIEMVIRLQVKPKSDRGTLADKDGILNISNEIEYELDPNDTIFVIGNDKAANYDKILTHCNDNQCPNRVDISKLKSLHGRLVKSTKVLSPCGYLECCDDWSDNEDCYCDKVISELEHTRKKNFCSRYKRRA